MNFFETLKQYRTKQRIKAHAIASLTDEHFFARIEALDTITCPECQSKILDLPYEPNACNVCSWTEDGRNGQDCQTPDCDGELEQINATTSFCFSCNGVVYSNATPRSTTDVTDAMEVMT